MPRPLLLAALALLAAVPASAQGRLAFDAERHAFGDVREGATATHVFSFTNAGTAPLTLTDVRASCGCTTPQYTTDAVAPGETGQITVAFDSRGRPGPFEKTVSVVADGAAPVTLRIEGNVLSAFAVRGVTQGHLTFEADVWDEGEVPGGQAVQRGFRYQNLGDRPIRIQSARTIPEGLDLVVSNRPVFGGDVGAVLVTIPDPAAIAREDGTFDVAVVLQTDDAEQPTKSLRLRGRVSTGE